jgi:hypothetical protein
MFFGEINNIKNLSEKSWPSSFVGAHLFYYTSSQCKLKLLRVTKVEANALFQRRLTSRHTFPAPAPYNGSRFRFSRIAVSGDEREAERQQKVLP